MSRPEKEKAGYNPALFFWSGKRDLNPRLQPWQGCTLPLSYSRGWRRHPDLNWRIKVLQTSALPLGYAASCWSGKRDLNPRLQPWQGCTLPAELFPLLLASRLRRHPDSNRRMEVLQTSALPLGYAAINKWSGRRDLNPRLQPWQGCTLPTELLPLNEQKIYNVLTPVKTLVISYT